MSCNNRNIKLRQPLQDIKLSHRYITLHGSLITPVFCACMVFILGLPTGIRHAVTMQFSVDADTEYIAGVKNEYTQTQYFNIEESF
jgi:hypothetical protein